MTPKLATIEKIHSIQPHFNADSLEVAKVKEWPVVVKKGEYKEGDFVIFIRIDSIVPSTNPYFAFMEKQHYRIWNARFRGAPSQGLVCPVDILGSGYTFLNTDEPLFKEGDDVTEYLGVTKYEKPLDESICGDAKGRFPTDLVSITDEFNLLDYPETLQEFRDKECYLTIKADGSSMTVIYNDGQVRVCSRKLEQKEGTGFWPVADKYDIPNKLRTLNNNLALQGECCGGKIQKNPMGLSCHKFFVFNIKDLSNGRWYGYQDILDFCQNNNIPMVELVQPPFIFDDSWTIDRLQAISNGIKYTTDTGDKRVGEGIVLRTTVPVYSSILGKSLSVKILNQEYDENRKKK